MAEVVLKGVSKKFGQDIGIADMSLVIPDGAFVVLLGPTGAGKTTTLRVISGLEAPDEGEILIDGRNVVNDTPAQRREEAAAQRRLDTSKRHIDRDPDRALRLLRRIVELHPDTRAAEEARGLIKQLESAEDRLVPLHD